MVQFEHDRAHNGVHGGHNGTTKAGHRQEDTSDTVESKLTKAKALGAHRADGAHLR
jgi:hypothetical protein